MKKLLDGQLLADYTKNMPTTKTAAMLTDSELLADARWVLAQFAKRGGNAKGCFSDPRMEGWREDVTKALTKAARAPKKHFGSFQVTKCLTWAATLGFTTEAVAAVLLINAGESI